MEKAKENKGITLVALIILIITMSILLTVSIYSGVGTIKYTRFMKIKTEMETLQASVNSWHEKNINGDNTVLDYGEEVEYSNYLKEFVAISASEEQASNYRLFKPEYLAGTIGIEGIENEYLISVTDRIVILVDGLIYQGKKYYTADDFELLNTDVNIPISSVDFNLVCGNNLKDLREEDVIVYDIKFYDGQKDKENNDREVKISNFTIEYSIDGGTNWQTVSSKLSKTEYNGKTAYAIKAIEDAEYKVRIKDRNGNIINRKDNTEKSIEVFNCSFPSFKNNDWQIYTPRQLRFLAEYVNKGYKLREESDGEEKTKLEKVVENSGHVEGEIKELTEDTWIYLMNDLDLGARPGPGTTNEEKWETEANEKIKWEPIGISTDKTLKSSFDGQNHIIKGVYVNREENINGIFGCSNTIQNLTVQEGYVKGKINTGGIIGSLRSGTVENCHNKDTQVINMDNSTAIGGIVGHSKGVVRKCTNTGMIKSERYEDTYSEAGGIVGLLSNQGKVYECINEGTVIGEGSVVGGIVGGGMGNNTVSKCINRGKVNGKVDSIGGVIGNLSTNSVIIESVNSGTVIGNGLDVGGIVGTVHASSNITGCINYGDITGDNSNIGGVAGIVAGTIEKCINTGTVTQKGRSRRLRRNSSKNSSK